MAKRKKLEKAAEKAFARAEEAVEAARKAAAKLDGRGGKVHLSPTLPLTSPVS